MPHDHQHRVADYNTAFALGVGLNTVYVAGEVIFGIWGNSLALLADAGHNLSDILGLLLSWGALRLARSQRTRRHTYGLRRTSILAALGNALLLLVAVGAIGWEAIHRFAHPAPVAGLTIIWVAAAGVLVNGVSALLFLRGRHQDLNIRAAFVHMAADAGVSLGVATGGAAILATGFVRIDPALSLIVAGVILFNTWELLQESANMAVDAVPKGIDIAAVENYLGRLPGVVDVHDLHIWPISTTETALTVHLVRPGSVTEDAFIGRICSDLHRQFGIGHSTVQIEHDKEADPCGRSDPSAGMV
jgi:cobalt-zinc-cadmium efflux system protein